MENKVIQLRAFEAKDLPMIAAWQRSAGQDPLEEHSLTVFGVVAQLGGDDVACAWLYVDNRSSVARMENLIRNPDAGSFLASEGLAHIENFFRQEAEKIGKLFEVDKPFEDTRLALWDAPPVGDEALDECERVIAGSLEEVEMPVTHRFTPGMYIRQIFIPAKTVLTSRIHLTEHPYVISSGEISVWTKEGGAVRLKAPHSGITKAGTRRLLFAHTDTIWTTFHVTNETDPEKIVNSVTTTRNALKEASL